MRHQFQKGNQETLKRKSFISWNTGLTKETDSRVKTASEKIKKSWTPDKLKKRSQSYKTNTMKKYGVENTFQLSEVKEKSKKSCMERYGVEHPQFSGVGYKWHSYVLPSGRIVKYQGYEHFCIRFLLESYNESDIIFDKILIPKISYMEDGKIRKHCPDFYVIPSNLLIDVKSDYIYKIHKENMKLKSQAAKNQGFDYKIMIFDKKGKIQETL